MLHMTFSEAAPAAPVYPTQTCLRRSDGVFLWLPSGTSKAASHFDKPAVPASTVVDKATYEKEQKARQSEHLQRVAENKKPVWQPCLHDSCPDCLGTGTKLDGSSCVHAISCSCPKCAPAH